MDGVKGHYMSNGTPDYDYMAPEERRFYNDRLQQLISHHLPPPDFITEQATKEGVSYAKMKSNFINSFKQQAWRETERHFNAGERWRAAKGALPRKAKGRPRGTGIHRTEAEKKAAHREAKARYKCSERGKLMRKVRKAENARIGRIAREEQLWEQFKTEQLAADWQEIDREQIQLLREYLAADAQPVQPVDPGVKRLINRLELMTANQECEAVGV
jgi:hypothetical protein